MAISDSEPFKQHVVQLHSMGFGNREMAVVLGDRHGYVGRVLSDKGLVANNPKGVPPTPVDPEHSLCRQCDRPTPNDDFALVRSEEDGRRQSICKPCRAGNARQRIGASPESYFRNATCRLRSKSAKTGVACSMRDGYLAALWEAQEGCCYYTGKSLRLERNVRGEWYGPSRRDDSISIDKVVPSNGYVEGNMVICSMRMNTIKHNLELDEIRDLMPGVYDKITALPMFLEHVRPVNGVVRNAAGRAFPVHILDRHNWLKSQIPRLREMGFDVDELSLSPPALRLALEQGAPTLEVAA